MRRLCALLLLSVCVAYAASTVKLNGGSSSGGGAGGLPDFGGGGLPDFGGGGSAGGIPDFGGMDIGSMFQSCEPAKGCTSAGSMCVKTMGFGACTPSMAADLAKKAGFCDINNPCSEGTCDTNTGECKGQCGICAAGEECTKVFSGTSLNYKCSSSGIGGFGIDFGANFDMDQFKNIFGGQAQVAGGSAGDQCGCAAGESCLWGKMCVKIPSSMDDLPDCLSFINGGSIDNVAGFLSSGQQRQVSFVDSNDGVKADFGSAQDKGSILKCDSGSFGGWGGGGGSSSSNGGSASAGGSGGSGGWGGSAGGSGGWGGNDGDTDCKDCSKMWDKYVAKLDDKCSLDMRDAAEGATVDVDMSGECGLVFGGKQTKMDSCRMKKGQKMTVALSGGSTWMHNMSLDDDCSVIIGGGAKRSDKKCNCGADVGQVSLTDITGPGAASGKGTIDFQGAVDLVTGIVGSPCAKNDGSCASCSSGKCGSMFQGANGYGYGYSGGMQSLGNCTVLVNDEVKIGKGVHLGCGGHVFNKDSRNGGKFIVDEDGVLNYTGDSFGCGLHVKAHGHAHIGGKGCMMRNVSVDAGGSMDFSSHVSPCWHAQCVKNCTAIGHLDKCEQGAKLVFRVRQNLKDNPNFAGFVAKFNVNLTIAELQKMGCTIVLQDLDGNQVELPTITNSLQANGVHLQSLAPLAQNTAVIQPNGITVHMLSSDGVVPAPSNNDGSGAPTDDNSSGIPTMYIIAGVVVVLVLALGGYCVSSRKKSRGQQTLSSVEMHHKGSRVPSDLPQHRSSNV